MDVPLPRDLVKSLVHKNSNAPTEVISPHCTVAMEFFSSTFYLIFQKCFTDRGWQRGKMVFLDLLALQFPNHNHCNVFLQLNNSVSEVPQKLPDERCSIVEEVSLLTEIRLCNNEAQVSYTLE